LLLALLLPDFLTFLAAAASKRAFARAISLIFSCATSRSEGFLERLLSRSVSGDQYMLFTKDDTTGPFLFEPVVALPDGLVDGGGRQRAMIVLMSGTRAAGNISGGSSLGLMASNFRSFFLLGGTTGSVGVGSAGAGFCSGGFLGSSILQDKYSSPVIGLMKGVWSCVWAGFITPSAGRVCKVIGIAKESIDGGESDMM
jgi:hypothetical protein